MASFYLRIYDRLPQFLKRRIHPLEEALQEFVREAAEQTAGGRILDAGAGESRFAHWFDRHHYLALDSTVGERSWDYSRLHLRGDLHRIPFRDSCLDGVLQTQVLEHVPRPEEVIREIFRVLKPGGKLFLTAPQGWHEHQQPHDYYRFTSFALRSLLESAGFRAIQVEPLGGYFHYLGQRLTYVPKILFQDRRGAVRVLLFPVELLVLFLFCFLSPLLCYYLDRFDRKREFTLGYRCSAVKPRRSQEKNRAAGGPICNPKAPFGILE